MLEDLLQLPRGHFRREVLHVDVARERIQHRKKLEASAKEAAWRKELEKNNPQAVEGLKMLETLEIRKPSASITSLGS